MSQTEIIKETFKIVIVLAFMQIIRFIASVCIYDSSDVIGNSVKIGVIALLIGILIFMARREKVSFSLFLISTNIKFVIVYSLISVILIFSVITMPVFTCGYTLKTFLPFLYAVMIIPLFEELLFRGFLWEKAKEMFSKNITVFLFILAVYILWTVSSAGILNYYTGTLMTGSLPLVFYGRITIGLVMGTILGFTRLVSKNTFTCILLHSILNMIIMILV